MSAFFIKGEKQHCVNAGLVTVLTVSNDGWLSASQFHVVDEDSKHHTLQTKKMASLDSFNLLCGI